MGNAIVVGGSTGIGRGIADAWADSGFDVTVYSRSEPVGDGATSLRWCPLDFRDAAAAQTVIEGTLPRTIDLVCYSSIYYTSKRQYFPEVSECDWIDQLKINLHGLWMVLKSTIPTLRQAGPGVFLSVSSEVVYNAGPARSGYAATKAAAASLVESVAQEEEADEVRFVQVLPAGMVDTPGIRARRPADFDYSDYMTPADFKPFAGNLAESRAKDMAGDVFVVAKGGSWHSLHDGVPVSQSRALS